MKKVRCMLADYGEGSLTVGAVYTVVRESKNYYWLDGVEVGGWAKTRFEEVPVEPERIAALRAIESGAPLNAGRKDDGGKLEWSLLMRGCYAGLRGVVQVLMFGARKYAADSWQLVPNARERYKDALYRHLSEIEQHGFYSVDEESELPHLFHVGCNALFLATFAARPDLGYKEKNESP